MSWLLCCSSDDVAPPPPRRTNNGYNTPRLNVDNLPSHSLPPREKATATLAQSVLRHSSEESVKRIAQPKPTTTQFSASPATASAAAQFFDSSPMHMDTRVLWSGNFAYTSMSNKPDEATYKFLTKRLAWCQFQVPQGFTFIFDSCLMIRGISGACKFATGHNPDYFLGCHLTHIANINFMSDNKLMSTEARLQFFNEKLLKQKNVFVNFTTHSTYNESTQVIIQILRAKSYYVGIIRPVQEVNKKELYLLAQLLSETGDAFTQLTPEAFNRGELIISPAKDPVLYVDSSEFDAQHNENGSLIINNAEFQSVVDIAIEQVPTFKANKAVLVVKKSDKKIKAFSAAALLMTIPADKMPNNLEDAPKMPWTRLLHDVSVNSILPDLVIYALEYEFGSPKARNTRSLFQQQTIDSAAAEPATNNFNVTVSILPNAQSSSYMILIIEPENTGDREELLKEVATTSSLPTSMNSTMSSSSIRPHLSSLLTSPTTNGGGQAGRFSSRLSPPSASVAAMLSHAQTVLTNTNSTIDSGSNSGASTPASSAPTPKNSTGPDKVKRPSLVINTPPSQYKLPPIGSPNNLSASALPPRAPPRQAQSARMHVAERRPPKPERQTVQIGSLSKLHLPPEPKTVVETSPADGSAGKYVITIEP